MIKNAKELPTIFYGKHFTQGLAEYRDKEGEPYRIMLNEDTLRTMDPTFAGKPLYVRHVEEVDLANLQNDADGYVIESFYNKADSSHWVKFIAVSDEAKDVIKKGWKLSNAYVPTKFGAEGSYHGVSYKKEILDGVFEHLALVNNPRYAESIILTPEEFKKYNADKNIELEKVSNSKQGAFNMFSFFKKTKVDNAELVDTSVVLPNTKREITIGQLINEADMEEKEKKNPEHEEFLKKHEELKDCHNALMQKHNELKEEHEALKKEHEILKERMNPEKEEKKEEKMDSEEEDKEAKKELEKLEKHEEKEIEEEEMEKKKQNNFNILKNAESINIKHKVLDLSEDKIIRGKKRYGSN